MEQARVYYVEPIGGHAGMFYYDRALCSELARQGSYDIIWVTCDETREMPEGVRVWHAFNGIYGERLAWLRGLRYVWGLWQVLWDHWRRGERAILHLHFFTVAPAEYLMAVLFKRSGGGVVFTAHDVVPFDAKQAAGPWVRRVYSLADRIIVHAEHGARELSDVFGCARAKVRVVPHGNYAPFVGEPVAQEEARRRLGLADSARIILFFGSIKRVKGLDTLLAAMPDILRVHPEATLVIAGRVWKDDFAAYEDLIGRLGVASKVEARLRFIPEEEAALYFQAADVVVLPYRKIYQSGVLLMAMSFGCPVVATHCGGMAEVVQDGLTGYLVPPENPSELADRVCALLQDPEGARQMGERARRYVERHFGWPAVARATLSVYAEVLGSTE